MSRSARIATFFTGIVLVTILVVVFLLVGSLEDSQQPVALLASPTSSGRPMASQARATISPSPTPALAGAEPQVTATPPLASPTREPQEPAEPAPTPYARRPKTLTIALRREPKSLYPLGENSLETRHIFQALFDGPVDHRAYAYQPVILEKLPSLDDGDAQLIEVEVTAGDLIVDERGGIGEYAGRKKTLPQLVVTFRLKEGLRWSDGTPLTAHDSVFGFHVASDPRSEVTARYTLDRTANYEALDDLTVRWTGLPGFLDPSCYVNFFSPLPRHLLQGMSPSDIASSEFASQPVGWGPFKIAEWVPGDHLTVVRNEHYFRASEGLPRLDTVVFKFIPDTNELLTQVLTGQVDIAVQDGLQPEQMPLLEQAQDQGLLKLYFATGALWEHLDFNLDPAGDEPSFFADPRVRQAVAYGTDREAMVAQVLWGKSQVWHSFVAPSHPAYPPPGILAEYPFDPELAKALLEQAGWVDKDGDGIREKDGREFSIELLTTSGSTMRLLVAQMFQQNMRDIGIDVRLDFKPAPELFADGPKGLVFGRRFDVAEFAWLTGVEPPVTLFTCEQIPGEDNGWTGWNVSGWCNETYDELAYRAGNTLATGLRLQLFHEAQRIFTAELPVLPLFAHLRMAAARPTVVNFGLDPSASSELWNIEELDLIGKQ